MTNTRRKSQENSRNDARFLWIGLTGGIATGKSTVSKIFQDLGLAVIDADQLAHEALLIGTPSYQKIVNHFGTAVLSGDGNIDRKVLAEKVFSNESEKLKLEAIVHPYVQDRVKQMQQEYLNKGHKILIYDVPLLFEKNLQDQFDFVIVVTSTEEVQIQRMKLRNQWSDSEIARRLANQLSLHKKTVGADFCIENNGTLEDLRLSVKTVLDHINKSGL